MIKINRRNLPTGTGFTRLRVPAACHIADAEVEKGMGNSTLPGSGSASALFKTQGLAELLKDGKGRCLVSSSISACNLRTGGSTWVIGETFC